MLNAVTATFVGAIALTSSAPQQSAQEIFERMRERQLERWETVDNYTVFQRMEGIEFPSMPGVTESGQMEIPMHYQKHMFDGQPSFGIVPGNEYTVAVGQAGDGGEYVNAEFFELMADGNRMTADALDAEMANSGMPLLPGMEYPGQMMRDNALFAEAGADAIREAEAGDFGRSNAAIALETQREMARRMRLVGREKVGDREAFHLRAEGLDRVLSEDGARFTLRAVNVWIDAAEYVTLKTTMEGDLEAEGGRQEVTMEQLFEDYRQVGPLYEPHRLVMRMKGLMGMMSEEDRKQLEEAQKQMEQLDEMEEQLANMPAAARGMVERQIAQARRQMDMLMGDGGFEMVTEVLRIEINTGPPPPGSRESGGPGGAR